MKIYSKRAGISLVVAGLLLSGCHDDKKTTLKQEETSSIPTDTNLTQGEDNTTVAQSTPTTTVQSKPAVASSSSTTAPLAPSQQNANSSDAESVTHTETNNPTSSNAESVTHPETNSVWASKPSDGTQEQASTQNSGDEEQSSQPSSDTTTQESNNTKETTESQPTETQSTETQSTESQPTETQSTETQSTETQTRAMSVTGSVVDGIISGGRVSIYDLNKRLLGSGSTDSKGAYSIPIAKLPTQYKVTVEDGRDSGVDGMANSNDKKSAFRMSAIVDREKSGEISVANVTPATTLVTSMVEDGKIPLDDARNQVDDALGVDLKTPLCKLNPSKNDKAYKAGVFLAMVLESINTDDKASLFKSLSQVVIEKKLKLKITNTSTTIEQLDLADIATRANISGNEIEKLTQVEPLIKKSITSSIESLSVVDGISQENQKQALAQRASWDSLIGEMHKSSIIDSERLSMVVSRVQTSMQTILDAQGLDASEPSNVALITSMIDENLDKDISSLTPSLTSLSSKYTQNIQDIEQRTTRSDKANLKKLIAKLYLNSDINSIEKIATLLQNSSTIEQLDDTTKTIEDNTAGEANSDEIQDALIDNTAAAVASRVEDGTIPTDDTPNTTENVKKYADKVVNDTGLYESIKKIVKVKVKIKTKAKQSRLSHADKSELRASLKVKKSLKVTIKSKNYTHIDSSASSNMLDYVTNMLTPLDENAYQERINALELSLANLSKAFDAVKYEKKVQESAKVIQKIKVKTTTNIIKTITKIKVVIKEKFIKESDDSSSVITDINNNVGNYEVGDDTPTRVIRLPQPRLDSMGNIKKIKFVI